MLRPSCPPLYRSCWQCMLQSTRDGTSRYRILIMPCYFPSPPPTVRLYKIIVCIFREKIEKAVYYFTKNDLKNPRLYNFDIFYVEILRFVSRRRAGCDPCFRAPSTPAKQLDVLLYCNWSWNIQLWENKTMEKYRAGGDRCESHMTHADCHTICQH